MQLSPDTTIFWQAGPIVLNATIVYSWIAMAVLVLGSWLVTRNLSPEPAISRGQNLAETLITLMRDQIRSVSQRDPGPFLPFIGTLFLFISVSNLLTIVPVYQSPAGSLSTTVALAICVFVAIPVYGIAQEGLGDYLQHYVEPSAFMLPFQIISEISRTMALALRLFGNILSGHVIIAILVSIMPLILPIALQAFELLIGQIQAYIFATLAMVYVASAMRTREESESASNEQEPEAA